MIQEKTVALVPSGGKLEMVRVKGAAVQHFRVPFNKVCRKIEMFIDVGGAVKRLSGHSFILRVYDNAGTLRKLEVVKCATLRSAAGWTAVDGLSLGPGWYHIEFFTNSKGLRPFLRVGYCATSNKTARGYAAWGWNGGTRTDGAFALRVYLTPHPSASDIKLGTDSAHIISNSRANYPIVVPADYAPAELTAAKTLRDVLQEVTGVEVPIVAADDYRSGNMLAVGFNAKLPADLRRPHFGEMKPQELLIVPGKNTLLLAGGAPVGTLYAVYEYLYRLGVRWYTPEYTKYPKLTNVPLPDTAYRYSPSVIGRNLNAGNRADNAWRSKARLTCNCLWNPLGTQYGLVDAEGPDMHTFWRLVPKALLRKHPDWLCEKNGKREVPVGTTWGLCLSNPEVRHYLIERTLDYAKKHTAKNVIWIGQNDGSEYCTCEKCRAFYAAHGGAPSSLMVQLVNELSDAMAKQLPGRMIKTLAYSWSLTPPANLTLRDNVIVMFCASGDFFRPIATDPARGKLREAWKGWREIAKHIDVYLYFPYEDYWSPAPCTYVGAENITWCVAHGANRLYAAVSGSAGSIGSESGNLRAWLYSRLMWDPTQDPRELIGDFIHGYYGPAADAVGSALKWSHEGIYDAQGAFKRHDNGGRVPDYVDPAVVRRINTLFEKIYAALPNGVYKRHFSGAWIPYLWADFWLGYKGTGQYDETTGTWCVPMADGARRNRYAKRVKRFMTEHGVNALRENRKFDPARLGIDKMGVPLLAVKLSVGAVEAVVLPSVCGRVFGFRDNKRQFTPLKERWLGLDREYPQWSTTRENVSGAPGFIDAYTVIDKSKHSVTLAYANAECSVQKEISIAADRTLCTEFTVTSKSKAPMFQTSMMFDLAENVFGFHPTLFLEERDGSWRKHVVGAETDFHWVEQDIALDDCSGRVVLRRQNGAGGVLLTLDPRQVKRMRYWYSRYKYDSERRENRARYCGMLRFFLWAKPEPRFSLSWSLQILPDTGQIVGQ